MTDFSHDWIGAVGRALPETIRVNMNIGDNNTLGLPTMRPEIAKPTAIDYDDAALQRVWIYVIVEDELLNPPRSVLGAQQKSATLTPTASTSPQFLDTGTPNSCATQNLRRRPEDSARERCY